MQETFSTLRCRSLALPPSTRIPPYLISVQVNGVEFKVVVPENCGPGKIIEMEVPSSLTREGHAKSSAKCCMRCKMRCKCTLRGLEAVTSRSSSLKACVNVGKCGAYV